MRAVAMLRAASVVALLQYTAHAILFITAVPHGAEATAAVDAMKSHRFEVTGLGRSYWDYYQGYGLMVIVTGVLEVGLLWQLASLAKGSSDNLRPVISTVLAANIAHAILAGKYFFVAPIVPDLVVAALLVWTLFALRTTGGQPSDASCVRSSAHANQEKTR